MDTRNEGLDIAAHAARVFADTPWLHYGIWLPGETVSFTGLRAAQERYAEKLLALIPPAPRRILDSGGGMGELAARLVTLGHDVEMITPSSIQANFARERLGDTAKVTQSTFEDYAGAGPFDVCLWSESFQYVSLDASLPKMKTLLAPDGVVVIADNFRRADFAGGRAPGKGHRWNVFEGQLAAEGYEILGNEDVTALVAPSMLLDQKFYREFAAPVLAQLDAYAAARRPLLRSFGWAVLKLFMKKRRREAFIARLKADYRSPEAFMAANTYRFLKLKIAAGR